MAAVSNLAIDQGTTFSVTITVTDDTGSARNLTNYTVRSQMRRSYYATSNTAFTANVSSPTDGTISLDLTSTQTSALRAGRYVYDVELVSNIASVERIVEGIVTIYPEVTR
jgi:hypothetical protein